MLHNDETMTISKQFVKFPECPNNFSLMPVKGKKPIMKNWQDTDDKNLEMTTVKKCNELMCDHDNQLNWAIRTGVHSGVIMLDLTVEGQEFSLGRITNYCKLTAFQADYANGVKLYHGSNDLGHLLTSGGNGNTDSNIGDSIRGHRSRDIQDIAF